MQIQFFILILISLLGLATERDLLLCLVPLLHTPYFPIVNRISKKTKTSVGGKTILK